MPSFWGGLLELMMSHKACPDQGFYNKGNDKKNTIIDSKRILTRTIKNAGTSLCWLNGADE